MQFVLNLTKKGLCRISAKSVILMVARTFRSSTFHFCLKLDFFATYYRSMSQNALDNCFTVNRKRTSSLRSVLKVSSSHQNEYTDIYCDIGARKKSRKHHVYRLWHTLHPASRSKFVLTHYARTSESIKSQLRTKNSAKFTFEMQKLH